MFKINNEETRKMSVDAVLVSLLLALNISHTLFYCFIVDLEQVNVQNQQ